MTQRMEYQLKWGVFGRLLDTMILRRKWDQGVKDFFTGLKKQVETGLSPAA